MKKILKINILEDFKIRCEFNNGEVRDLDITTFMDRTGNYSKKVYDKSVFCKVKLGEFGQLYWEGIAEMKTLEGKIISTDYDICPDFAYMNSVPITLSLP